MRVKLYYFLIFSLLVFYTAIGAVPPKEEGIFREPELVELVNLDTSFKLDVRYATSNNFMKQAMYESGRAFLQKPAADALVKVSKKAAEHGLGLLILDAYRPWYVTKYFWDNFPNSRNFLADPAKGSKHNRGCAIDLTFYDLKSGLEITMPSPFDDFTEKAAAHYTGGTKEQRLYRDLLRKLMESEGFTVLPHEWWHFDYKDWKSYPIMNIKFSDIK